MNKKESVLLVIDVQKDFCLSSGFSAKRNSDISSRQKVTKKIKNFIKQLDSLGVEIIYIKSNYDEYKIHNKYYPMCRKGTKGEEFYLIEPNVSDKVILKKTHDAYYRTDLEKYLKQKKIKNIFIVGLTTPVCIYVNATESVVRGFATYIVRDCVFGDKRFDNVFLKAFELNFGFVLNSKDLIKKIVA